VFSDRGHDSGSFAGIVWKEGVYRFLGIFRRLVNTVEMLKGIHFILVR
jgi:hypothetical protein